MENIDKILENINTIFKRKKVIEKILSEQPSTVLPKEQSTVLPKPQSFHIYISASSITDLSYIGAGVPNAVYYDQELDGVVKFKKSERVTQPLFYKSTYKMGLPTISLPINEFKGAFPQYNNIVENAITIQNVIQNLPSFLQIKGYVIYPKILTTRNVMIPKEIANSVLYDYLGDVSSYWKFNSKLKKSIKQIVLDFKTLNLSGLAHGDLSNNCRNIVLVTSTGEVKVIDIDSIKSIYSYMGNFYRYQEFTDLFGLIDCFISKDIFKNGADIKEEFEKLLPSYKIERPSFGTIEKLYNLLIDKIELI